MARPLDLVKVERAKALRATGKSYSRIAKMMGVSLPTIQRWVNMEQEGIEDKLDKKREDEAENFVSEGWELIHTGLAQLKVRLNNEEIKSKELITMIGVIFDKIMAVQTKNSGTGPDKPTIVFNLYSSQNGESVPTGKYGLIANTGEVSPITGEVQGDDMRPGSGENILALPGSCDDIDAVSGDDGSDCCIDVSEPE